ncbi:MAG: 1-deoxy-D-xylulose-5-phosphate synthase [Planctomycetales bacterium]|nr:1-deoxy-D-xylulose-5-phosphate synthase [Planctomycetales bacterium]
MAELLAKIHSPLDLQGLSVLQLNQLAEEMRETLCNLVSQRAAHFASNLGVVELCLALHTSFDFRHDRLIWDTGHQIYPHKMVTGRIDQFDSIRTRGGLMGYPNPAESDYDLFMTGHAGCSVSTILGLRSGDDRLRPDEGRHAVAVIGDGAFPSGIVYEAMNNAGGLKCKLLVVLNDNRMSICPRVGGLADMLDRMRTTQSYTGLKAGVINVLDRVPLVGRPLENFLGNFKEALKAGLHGGMLFEDLGFRYVGPIDGHNIGLMRKYMSKVKTLDEPVLLHVVTEKGHGFRPAAQDPVYFHTPAPFTCENENVVAMKGGGDTTYTGLASAAIEKHVAANPKVTVITAAMCQGNKLEGIRERYADQFFDVGICESHAVAFAAGQAKAGLRPIVDIYSTFLQRSYDQIFQEVALQNLPVTFMMDRAGLTGPDGPTHHGVFDIGYLRVLPNLTVMAPGDAFDLTAMLDFALRHEGPVTLRYPKAAAKPIAPELTPAQRSAVELGKAEILRRGDHGTILCCGTQLDECLRAAEMLQAEGFQVGVINARFVKPLDTTTILQAVRQSDFVVTVEEASLMGGFGSAVLEAVANAGVTGCLIQRIGIPDEFVEHGDRQELLAEIGLTASGIAKTCRQLAQQLGVASARAPRQAS